MSIDAQHHDRVGDKIIDQKNTESVKTDRLQLCVRVFEETSNHLRRLIDFTWSDRWANLELQSLRDELREYEVERSRKPHEYQDGCNEFPFFLHQRLP